MWEVRGRRVETHTRHSHYTMRQNLQEPPVKSIGLNRQCFILGVAKWERAAPFSYFKHLGGEGRHPKVSTKPL